MRGVPGSKAPHGTLTRYSLHRCRCDECRQARHDYYVKRARARGVSEFKPHETKHGTVNEYANYGCRCEECRQAWRVYFASKPWHENYRRKNGIRPIAEVRAEREPNHGTESRYVNRGCRCDLCREAATQARRRRRQRSAA